MILLLSRSVSGLEILSFTVTRRMFRTKRIQGAYFENEFRKGKVIAFSYPHSLHSNPSPSLLIWIPLPRVEQLQPNQTQVHEQQP